MHKKLVDVLTRCLCLIVPLILKLFKIKIIPLPAERMGAIAVTCETFLRKRALGLVPEQYRYVFICSEIIANRFLFLKYKEKLCMLSSAYLDKLLQKIVSEGVTKFLFIMPALDKAYYEFLNAGPALSFTEEEQSNGVKALKSLGVNYSKDKYVCLFSRDSQYLQQTYPGKDWSYHDYRNLDIDVFEETALYLISEGYYVVRVGRIVEKPMSLKHPMLIDYAVMGADSDFMDIFLLAHCEFLVGTEGGLTDIPKIFDVPELIANYSRIGARPWGKSSLYIPAKLRNKGNGEKLSFKKIINKKYDDISSSVDLKKLGLELIKNTKDEILKSTKEMVLRVKGKFSYTEEQRRLMKKVVSCLYEKNEYSEVKTLMGVSFLEDNKWLLEE